MAEKGEPETKEGVHPDPVRDYDEEKIRMKSAKTLMTKKIKRLETALTDYEELQERLMNVKMNVKLPTRKLKISTPSLKLNSLFWTG